jgi:hypothetical protein
MALQRSTLDKFKLELGNNFNEHHLENILFELYNGEKHFIRTTEELCIQDLDPIPMERNSVLSEDGRFLWEYDYFGKKLNIYTVTTFGSFKKYLYTSIVGVPLIMKIQMHNNVIYYQSDGGLSIIDIKNLTITFINDKLLSRYHVYKGIVCTINKFTGVTIFNVDGSRYNMSIKIDSMDRQYYKDGILYVLSEDDKIYIIDIEKNTYTVSNNKDDALYICPSLYGNIILPGWRNLILPSSKVIDPPVLLEGIKSFKCGMSLNKIGNILMCGVDTLMKGCRTVNSIMFINIENETVINTIHPRGIVTNFGFLESSIAEIVEPTIINYKELKMI